MTPTQIKNVQTALLTMESTITEMLKRMPEADDLYDATTPDAFASARRHIGAIVAQIDELLPKLNKERLPKSLANICTRFEKIQAKLAEIETFMNKFLRENFPSNN